MTTGIKLEQWLFRNDEQEIDREEMTNFLEEFMELCAKVGYTAGGSIKLFKNDESET